MILKTIFIFICLTSQFVWASDNAQFKTKIKKLVDKNYRFFALKDEDIIYLNGSSRNRIVTYKEFTSDFIFSKTKSNFDIKYLYTSVLDYKSDGWDIIIKKNKKYFIISNPEISEYEPLSEEEYERFNKEEVEIKKEIQIKQTFCSLCQLKVSLNKVSVESGSQYVGEFAWLPYLLINDNFGIRFSLAISPYYLKDEDDTTLISYGTKGQALLRGNYSNFYIEAGGGLQYFTEFDDTSSMYTMGIGYVFLNDYWIFTEAFKFNGIMYHFSNIQWDETITESKVGFGFSF